MKILYLSNIPSPYRVDFFNELGKHCDLTVLFEIDNSTERDDSWKNYNFKYFNGIILKGKRTSLDTAFCPSVIKYMKKNQYDFIIVTVLASFTALLAVTWMKLKGISYCYEGDGGRVQNSSKIKTVLKKYIISTAKLCFSTSKEFDQYCITYGANAANIRRYPFTSIKRQDILLHLLSEEEKNKIKKKLGVLEKRIILSVGRVINLKGYDVLLNSVKDLDTNWGVYIIGGVPGDEFLSIIRNNNLKNVHFIDFQKKEIVKEYYLASDIFVLPTRYDPWGLVINEAMAAGLPIITTYQCGAGTELVENDVNGYLYDSEDVNQLRYHMNELTMNSHKRALMGEQSLIKIKDYTTENMAVCHEKVFEDEYKRIRGK